MSNCIKPLTITLFFSMTSEYVFASKKAPIKNEIANAIDKFFTHLINKKQQRKDEKEMQLSTLHQHVHDLQVLVREQSKEVEKFQQEHSPYINDRPTLEKIQKKAQQDGDIGLYVDMQHLIQFSQRAENMFVQKQIVKWQKALGITVKRQNLNNS